MRSIFILIFFVSILAPLDSQAERFLVGDHSAALELVAGHIDPEAHGCGAHMEIWRDYLARPHPDVMTLRGYFEEAGAEFAVPPELLMAIGRVESNWTQIGPSIDQGWGLMHLVDNGWEHTLAEAAGLLGHNTQWLKDDARQNIRGAAALLASYGGADRAGFTLADWFAAAAQFSALGDAELEIMQARRYFEVLCEGSSSSTLWGETIVLPPHPGLAIPEPAEFGRSWDYPPAIPYYTPCNYTDGRNHALDTWVNHWIGVGTYAGAISWFHNCDAQVSAHFVIRNWDGEITQLVHVNDTAWHCGAYGYPYNNSRSIGVEHEATLANPDQWSSQPMLEASTLMANHFCNEYGIPMERALPGIRGHNEMPGTATQCPGNLPWDQWMEYLLSPVSVDDFAPAPVANLAVWPNPFNPRTRIVFTLERREAVELTVYDTTGRRVRKLYTDTVLDAGEHEIVWDGRDDVGCGLSSGVYLCNMVTPAGSIFNKLVMLK
jgi:hypothetical protein